MKRQLRNLTRLWPLLGFATLAACSDPLQGPVVPVEAEGEEVCEASEDWFPDTPELSQFLPPPHPAGECPFYRSAWQNFLRAMQPDTNGVPAMVNNSNEYLTIDQLFQHAFPHPVHSYLGDIKQAGNREILVDQNGRTLYYGIAVNKAFSDFIHQYGLDSAANLQAYPDMYPNLVFPGGLVEFKSAWQEVDGTADEIAAQTQDFISMETTVPTISQDADGTIHEDRDNPRTVTVRLLAIHVVTTLVGHPEFVWGSLEHSTALANDAEDRMAVDGHRDVAPLGLIDGQPGTDFNPDPNDLNRSISDPADPNLDYILYKKGAPINTSNRPRQEQTFHLDAAAQKFLDPNTGEPEATNIYRMFPASKSNTIDPDAAITSLNHNVGVLFQQAKAANRIPQYDRRGNYRLVGAQWMDKPRYFQHNSPLQNDDTSPMIAGPHYAQDGTFVDHGIPAPVLIKDIVENGSDSEFSILAGEDRMSSTAMESFTQAPGAFNNCFTCHNTQGITASGIPTDKDPAPQPIELLKPGLLNVSHVLSQYLLEEHEDAVKNGAAP